MKRLNSWNEANDEILSVFAQVFWTLKFIFPSSQLFLVSFQATIYIFSFNKM